MKPIRRLYIGPIEIAGYYSNLAKGFQSIGVTCEFVPMTRHRFGYFDKMQTPILVLLFRIAAGFRNRLGKVVGAPFAMASWAFQFLYMLQAIVRYDCFIFSYGNSLLPRNRDLRILRMLKKKVIIVLHGSEVRPSYVDGMIELDGPESVHRLMQSVRTCADRVRQIERSGVTIVANPLPTFCFGTKRMLNFLVTGLPYTANAVAHQTTCESAHQSLSTDVTEKAVRILHCPSHLAGKGTKQFRSAITSLKNRGYNIDYVEVVNRPNQEVIDEIKRCDFVLDQVFSDFPLAGFPTEAAWYGKPAIVGGYGFDDLRRVSPVESWPPSLLCKPDEIESAIEKLIVDQSLRVELGKEAQEFVRRNWAASAVARRYLTILEGNAPEEWYWTPTEIAYIHGWGQTEEVIRKKVRALVSSYGDSSLGSEHRSDLKASYLSFAGLGGS